MGAVGVFHIMKDLISKSDISWPNTSLLDTVIVVQPETERDEDAQTKMHYEGRR
jgi:hypothetical protein